MEDLFAVIRQVMAWRSLDVMRGEQEDELDHHCMCDRLSIQTRGVELGLEDIAILRTGSF